MAGDNTPEFPESFWQNPKRQNAIKKLVDGNRVDPSIKASDIDQIIDAALEAEANPNWGKKDIRSPHNNDKGRES